MFSVAGLGRGVPFAPPGERPARRGHPFATTVPYPTPHIPSELTGPHIPPRTTTYACVADAPSGREGTAALNPAQHELHKRADGLGQAGKRNTPGLPECGVAGELPRRQPTKTPPVNSGAGSKEN